MRQPRQLTRYKDPRGVPYVTVTIRVTGEAAITAFEELCEQAGVSPPALATELVAEELWYLRVPGMRDHVRRARAERRHQYAPAGNKR